MNADRNQAELPGDSTGEQFILWEGIEAIPPLDSHERTEESAGIELNPAQLELSLG